MTRTPTVPAVALAAVLLAGCGDAKTPVAGSAGTPTAAATTAGSSTPAASPSPSAPPAAGPAENPVTWPDGLTAKLVKVERMPNRLGEDVPKNKAIIRVTVTLTNTGTKAIPLDPDMQMIDVLSGPNQTEGEVEPGWDTDNPAELLQVDAPRQVAPGKTVTIMESDTVPVADLGVLAIEVDLPRPGQEDPALVRRPYLFTDAHKLLKR